MTKGIIFHINKQNKFWRDTLNIEEKLKWVVMEFEKVAPDDSGELAGYINILKDFKWNSGLAALYAKVSLTDTGLKNNSVHLVSSLIDDEVDFLIDTELSDQYKMDALVSYLKSDIESRINADQVKYIIDRIPK